MQPFDRDRHKPEEPLRPPGLQLLFCRRDAAVVFVAKMPDALCCYGKLIRSSVIITILEELMSRTAQVFLKKEYRTKQMHVAFMKPIQNTGTLKGEGRILSVEGKRVATIEGVIFNGRKEISAKSTSEWTKEPDR
ncbi:hotdog fold domain-containing protein [Desulfoluna sp.]|uniref:PaaI family thioesterase n=1 Tax=Desulfoluna sp. TaxID=2045199 RepID=UPI002624614E|nr:hotdog fold domain-containing protein [Desulfoluna sp.]